MAKVRGGEKIIKRIREIASHIGAGGKVRAGFFENATYPDGTPVAMVAAIQNWGAPRAGIPPRPFFSNMVKDKSPTWGAGLAKALKATDYDVHKSLAMMGEQIVGDLRQSIKDTNDPPLAASTIRRKGFDKPLIDSAHMFNSADYEVVGGGDKGEG